MDRTALFLGALGLIGAIIGTANAIAFRKNGRIGHLICASAIWMLISAPLVLSSRYRSAGFEVLFSGLLANGFAMALVTLPLWFFQQDVSNRVLFGVTIAMAFAVGWFYIGIPWLTACLLFGKCDP